MTMEVHNAQVRTYLRGLLLVEIYGESRTDYHPWSRANRT